MTADAQQAPPSLDELFGPEPEGSGPRNLGAQLRSDLPQLAENLSALGATEKSALAKSRAKLASAVIYSTAGASYLCAETVREAAHAVPRVAVTALFHRAFGAHSEPTELLAQNLEQIVRLNELPGARAQAALRLSDLLAAQGEMAKAAAVLEPGFQGAPSLELQLRRAALLLGAGQPTLAAVPADAPDWVLRAWALRTEARSTGVLHEPTLVRAGRCLRRSSLSEAGQALSCSQDDDLFLVGCSLLATSAQTSALAKEQLASRKTLDPRATQLWLTLGSETGDGSSLASAIEHDTQTTHILGTTERLLLRTWAGKPAGPGAQEEVDGCTPALRLAAQGGAPTTGVPAARFAAGRHLKDLASLEAREALERWRAVEPEGPACLTSFLVLSDKDQAGAAWLLDELGLERGEAELSLLAGRILERAGLTEDALALYGRLSRGPFPQVSVAAVRGTERLVGRTADSLQALLHLAEQLPEPSRTAIQLESSLFLPTLAAADQLLALADTQHEDPESRRALLLTAEVLLRGAGATERAGGPLGAAVETNPESPSVFLLALESVVEGTPVLLSDVDKLVEHGAERRLLRALDAGLRGNALEIPLDESLPFAALKKYVETRGDEAVLSTMAQGVGPESPLLRAIVAEEELTFGREGRTSMDLISFARGEANGEQKRAALSDLIAFEEARGDRASASMWRSILLEEDALDTSAWLDREAELLSGRRTTDWLATLGDIAAALPEEERADYEELQAALSLAGGDLRSARRHLARWAAGALPSEFVSWASLTLALDAQDPAQIERWLDILRNQPMSPGDEELFALERTLRALDSQRLPKAQSIRSAMNPNLQSFLGALLDVELALARPAAEGTEPGELAVLLDRLGEQAHVTEHQFAAARGAARAYEQAGDLENARARYELCLKLDPRAEEPFVRLRDLYQGSPEKLVQLLKQRLELPLALEDRLPLELELCRLWVALGQSERALPVLTRAVSAHPRDLRVLTAHAALAERHGDHRAAYASQERLFERANSQQERERALRAMARLALGLGKLEQAMNAHEALLALLPGDRANIEALISVLCDLRLGERAATLQTELIQSAVSSDDKIKGALELARIFSEILGDPGRASATLERAGRAWPLEPNILRARALLMNDGSDAGAKRLMLERTAKEARRQLENGGLDRSLLETIAVAAELTGRSKHAEGARLAAQVVAGRHDTPPLPGLSLSALGRELDALLSPPEFVLPLRRLLEKTGGALDLAFSVDLAALDARPAPPEITQLIQSYCRNLKLTEAEVFESATLGSRCLPVTSSPLRFVIGPGLVGLPSATRDYMILKSIKLQLMGAGALARSRPEDAWAMVAALVLLFAPQARVASVDPRKVAQARALVERGLSRVGYADDVPTLAMETAGALGQSQVDLTFCARQLANRSALLALGDLHAALDAIGRNDRPLPSDGPSRLRWFENHPEARDLVLFMASAGAAEARDKHRR